MMDVHNEKKRIEYETQRNVIFNAIVNTKRKRNSRVIPLFSEHEEKSPMEIMNERSELFGKKPLA